MFLGVESWVFGMFWGNKRGFKVSFALMFVEHSNSAAFHFLTSFSIKKNTETGRPASQELFFIGDPEELTQESNGIKSCCS